MGLRPKPRQGQGPWTAKTKESLKKELPAELARFVHSEVGNGALACESDVLREAARQAGYLEAFKDTIRSGSEGRAAVNRFDAAAAASRPSGPFKRPCRLPKSGHGLALVSPASKRRTPERAASEELRSKAKANAG